jgi:hypothetical protein
MAISPNEAREQGARAQDARRQYVFKRACYLIDQELKEWATQPPCNRRWNIDIRLCNDHYPTDDSTVRDLALGEGFDQLSKMLETTYREAGWGPKFTVVPRERAWGGSYIEVYPKGK